MLFCDVPGAGGHLAGFNQDILSGYPARSDYAGHPEPRESSSLPHLRLVQSGVRREHAISSPTPKPPAYPLPHSSFGTYDLPRRIQATTSVCSGPQRPCVFSVSFGLARSRSRALRRSMQESICCGAMYPLGKTVKLCACF